jgi:hypothetical protein
MTQSTLQHDPSKSLKNLGENEKGQISFIEGFTTSTMRFVYCILYITYIQLINI